MKDTHFVIPFDRLPERFAETIQHPPGEPAVPRPAATIVLLRDGAEGAEVLLMRRTRSSGFVPGAYVFPGGRVDGSDAGAPLLDRLDGLTTETAETRLDLAGAEPPALAYYLAALREAFEETGILIGCRTDGSPVPTAAEDLGVDRIRDDLMEDRIDFAEALDRLECRIDGRSVEYLAHWITPIPEPRRYDTRFFAAKTRADALPIVDPREMTDAVWATPSEALRRHEAGRLPMVFPTIRTLQQLAAYRSATDALSDLATIRVRTIMPTLVVTPTGVGMELDEGS